MLNFKLDCALTVSYLGMLKINVLISGYKTVLPKHLCEIYTSEIIATMLKPLRSNGAEYDIYLGIWFSSLRVHDYVITILACSIQSTRISSAIIFLFNV